MTLHLEPAKDFQFFEEISRIPRGSGNEAAVAAYLVEWAEKRGLAAQEDSHHNVYIRKAASPGKEARPAVMLQGHLDMVCEKEAGCTHDFLKDPISMRVDDDGYIRANGTSLGADNGIGVALIMAVLDDPKAVHPLLEALFTADEEAGMTGARALPESGWSFRAKTLLNLDTGWEGVFVAGAAGGGRVEFQTQLRRQERGGKRFAVTVSGLRGGHSGAEIHLGRGNANQILLRILNVLAVPFALVSLSGFGKDNAITRNAEAVIACGDETALREEIGRIAAALKKEYRAADPDLEISVAPVEEAGGGAVSPEDQARLLRFLFLLPCGVLARDNEMDLVLTSMNIGSVALEGDRLVVRCSVRSALPTHLSQWLLPQLRTLADTFGVHAEESDFYPGWEFQAESPIRDAAMAAYRDITGKEAVYKVLHGGLECGILMEELGFTDAISYGAALNHPHSPAEELCISSVGTSYRLIQEVLKKL